MSERIKLNITEVEEPKPVGEKGTPKLAFKAKGPDGKELSYFTFRTSLFGEIKIGAVIDAEVKVETKEAGGNIYTNRQVNQIYRDGVPVGGTKAKGMPYQLSPVELASVEARLAFEGTVGLLIAKVISLEDDWGKAAKGWAMAKMQATPVIANKTAVRSADEQFDALGSAGGEGFTTDDLLARIAEVKGFKTHQTARSFLINSCKISGDRIDTDPKGVYEEVKGLL